MQDQTQTEVIRFADRDEKPMGYESMSVHLAKSYVGDTYGMHFLLIQATEVAIAFHEGDLYRIL
ncbi:hypothetical protein BHE86_14730 [Shigella sp. FC1655]|nr:hypothetical protein BGK50_15735 [Shigella sp. FC130]OEI95064.1 hypothetical protein BHE86_14730 [Shigella sp. FC1655]